MPYTKKEARAQTEQCIAEIVSIIRKHPDADMDGEVNFAISSLVARIYRPASGWRYHWLHRAHGVFATAGAEFYRRLVAPYEDRCIEKNGDLAEYREFAGD